ncbi:hypothetical protein EI94DRAFT_1144384 [Lactarius quietus]|nr:hypothetical protein EI94DRAFT_1144384 [Lactarius quietus]
MELPPHVYSSIVRHVERREDLRTLCLASKILRAAAERKLYRSLDMREPSAIAMLCNILSERPRLSQMVVEFTISPNEEGLYDNGTNYQTHELQVSSPPSDYLASLYRALRRTTNLRLLYVHLSHGIPLRCAWTLSNCSFRLHTFHCDIAWDAHLVSFLSTQLLLFELHISDFNEDIPENAYINARSLRHARTIPNLSTLNCTFTGAVGTLVPGRPVTHVKTCFSGSGLKAKRVELALLLANLRLSTKPLHSLLLADESYTTPFSLELLSSLVKAFGPIPQLKFVGPLVLPVDGHQRLTLYGLLARLRELRSAELDVSEWEPPPVSFLALRALAREVHLYIPSVSTLVFVRDLEPIVLRAVGGIWSPGDDIIADTVWRTV